MSPQPCPQGLSPLLRRTEELAQLFFFSVRVGTQRRMNLDLCLQHHALDYFGFRNVGDHEFEMKERHDAVNSSLHSRDFEVEIRHRSVRSWALPLRSVASIR